MKNKNVIVLVIIIAGLFLGAWFLLAGSRGHKTINSGLEEESEKDIYYCPMHPNFTSDKAGSCSICGMSLVKKEKVKQSQSLEKKVKKLLYYRNPMNPEVTSPVPMKDSMGMDYVPVYEEQKESGAGVYISSERQQLAGVRKEKVGKVKLSREILTVGKVAYDPELFVSQEEYLQALKVLAQVKESKDEVIKDQMKAFAEAARKKLLLMGMSQEEIEELARNNTAQNNLYLPVSGDKVWVYMTIYEYEIGLVNKGLPVEIEAGAFPGEVFKGKILSFSPIIDNMTRSLRARAEIDNPDNKLKPDMFVNAKINIDLGEKLAVVEEAVINTGKRMLVVVSDDEGNFFSRGVKLGQKAQGYYEVLDGLKEGDTVVASGNFLIDSESRLQSAISSEHTHGQ